jgi:hypothetical protein
MAAPVDLKEIAWVLVLVLVLGLVILYLRSGLEEGFTGGMRCGVDMAPCPAGLKCVNGFCAETDPKPVREEDPIPLLPSGSPAPYT